MKIADLSISLGGSFSLFLLLAALAVLASYFFYRFTLPPLPMRQRAGLSLLRTSALILLLIIIFEPIVRLIDRHTQDPKVAVLVDASQSMSLRDAEGIRSERVKSALDANLLKGLPGGATAEIFPFGATLNRQPLAPGDSIAFTGEMTNIAEALGNLKERMRRENIQLAVLLSDGNYTSGRNPLYESENLGVPVYTVGIGDTADPKDVLIDHLVTNVLAYTETQIPIDVVLRSSGFGGENVEVTIADGAKLLDRRVVTLRPGVNEYQIRMLVTPTEEGMKKYVASVSALAGELTTKNNRSTVFVKVLKSKLRVAVIGGAPHVDVSAVTQALREDQRMSVQDFVQKGRAEFYGRAPSREIIDSADCLVFVGYPSAVTQAAELQLFRDAVVTGKKPLLFLNGRLTDYTKLAQFQEVLPFAWSSSSGSEVLVSVAIPEREKHHSLIALEGKIVADDWANLPPLYKTQTTFKTKPEAVALAYAVLQNITLPEPLMAVRNIAGQKSFAVTGEGIWRWRLMAQANSRTEDLLQLLLTNAVRWLTTKEDDRKVRIAPVKEVFTSAEPVAFTGQVYDEQLRPVDNAEVNIRIEQGAQKFELTLTSIGNGLYEGAMDGLGEGDYAYLGTAAGNGRTIGTDKGRFSIGEVNVEFLETKMNKQLLEQIAFRTGGMYLDLSAAGSLAGVVASSVKFIPKEIVEASEIELWNWKYLAGMLVALLALEWFLRKRIGML